MESETQGVRSVEVEGRYLFAGPVSVAWQSDAGPREQNQDSACGRLRVDGSWLIAVADGLGGHPRGRAAARRAIRALPRRISGADELFDAFKTAHRAVTKLTPGHLRHTLRDATMCPATTLSVAAWAPARSGGRDRGRHPGGSGVA
ncbi:protein phosphatase 2C domain-containing protein [Candidatus Poriferisodalis sp.]|uniref:protein phosphatase 2C domain-containing protein n=1 Tax=Candidatus Poriferisodalis sp. TaxID=3101277 RepID=UPI003B02E232